MKQRERLLFLQGNRCFLCREAIPPGEASVEHLVAIANGGGTDDENCIVCCKAANAALGSLSVKDKLNAVLNHRGPFVCPHRQPTEAASPSLDVADNGLAGRLALVVTDLQRRGPARPKRVATLKNTIAAVFQNKLPEGEVDALVSALKRQGYVKVEKTKVSYALPQQGA